MTSSGKSLPVPPLSAAIAQIGARVPEVILLFDTLSDVPLWIKDFDGRYCWVNLAFLQNFGFESRDEVLGQTDFDLCDLQLAEQYRVDDLRVLAGERIAGRQELIGRFDHTSRWCSTTKIPLHDPNGQIVGTAGVTLPLSDKPQATPGEPLSPAIGLISEHLNGEVLSNDELARVCNLSLRTFERNFRARYNCTPQHYIRHLRVRKSCHTLVFSSKSLAEIAADLGFTDQSHFNREFRSFIGETPGNYRRRHQQ